MQHSSLKIIHFAKTVGFKGFKFLTALTKSTAERIYWMGQNA
jgi:hypothetical protein